jgi:hypothetical protein
MFFSKMPAPLRHLSGQADIVFFDACLHEHSNTEQFMHVGYIPHDSLCGESTAWVVECFRSNDFNTLSAVEGVDTLIQFREVVGCPDTEDGWFEASDGKSLTYLPRSKHSSYPLTSSKHGVNGTNVRFIDFFSGD